LSDKRYRYRSVQWLFQNARQEPAMRVLRNLLCLILAASPAIWNSAAAQVVPGAPSRAATSVAPLAPPHGAWLPGGRSYLGLNIDRLSVAPACAGISLTCDDTQRPLQLYAGTMLGNFWGVEMSYAHAARIPALAGPARTQGLNFSLVGKKELAPSLGVFGKVGTTYARSDAPALAGIANADRGFGLSFGGGVSYDFTPRLSATLEWESNDFRFAGREPVRSTSLGLKYRY
jgi:OmpA-OmpF porin, OOP family